MKKYLLLLLTISFFISCSKDDDTSSELENSVQEENIPLVADFKFQSETISENDDLNIENLSKGAVTYQWDFGDNQIFTSEVPDFKYFAHGIYYVTLTVTNEKGEEDSVTKTIDVLCLFGGGNHGVDEAEI